MLAKENVPPGGSGLHGAPSSALQALMEDLARFFSVDTVMLVEREQSAGNAELRLLAGIRDGAAVAPSVLPAVAQQGDGADALEQVATTLVAPRLKASSICGVPTGCAQRHAALIIGSNTRAELQLDFDALALFLRAAAAELRCAHAEEQLRGNTAMLALHQSVLLQVAAMEKSDFHSAIRNIVTTDARTLNVQRVSFWTLEPAGRAIVCRVLYDGGNGSFSEGARLEAERYPAYFAALQAEGLIVAHDAWTDARTCEFAESYFKPNNITSMLDTPVWNRGRLAGVLCHEQVGTPRRWSLVEQDFARGMADMVSLALETSERSKVEASSELMARANKDVTWEWDIVQNRITYNDAITSVFGFERSDIVETVGWWFQHVHPEDRGRVEGELMAAVERGDAFWSDEYRFIRKDGSVATVHDRGFFIRDVRNKALRMIGSALDNSQQHTLEQQLLLADRMASVGTLAAGVAHEINNPLAYTRINLEFALRRLAAEPGTSKDVMDALRESLEGTSRVQAIVRDLKTFSRPEKSNGMALDVHTVVESTLNIALNEIRHRARLVKDFHATPPISGNEARLGQVLLNLLINAAHAIEEGAVEDNEIRIATFTGANGHACIRVSDTGNGIPADVIPRIFDPFFTTKRVGVGTGLGLSICHSIVTSMGGQISLQSLPGRGTVFEVSFPPAPPDVGQLMTEKPRSGPLSGRVLVIDDEAHIGSAFKRALGEEHNVTSVTAARAALELIRQGISFDVIFCDLMMPEMTGMDFHAELLRSAPEVSDRVVWLTGGAFTQRGREFLERVAVEKVVKPFNMDELRRIVARRVIQTRGAA